MSQYSAAALGGALVVIEQASETGSTPYPTPGVVWASMLQECIAPALMRPFAMVVHDEFGHGLPEVTLPQRNDPIQTFFFDRAHEPFGVCVGVRCTIRRLDDVQSRLGQQLPHPATPLRVPIADEDAVMNQRALVGKDQAAGDLLHEEGVGMGRRAQDLYSP